MSCHRVLKDFEIIIADDGSTDETKAAIRPFLSLPKVHYFYQTNSGKSAARNLGIEKSCGDWLLFLDSDDMLLPSALENFSLIACRFPTATLIAARAIFIDVNNRVIDTKRRMNTKEEFLVFIYPQLVREIYFPMGTYILQKQSVGSECHFDTSLESCQDYDFCLRASLRCKAVSVNSNVAKIRIHEGNTSSRRQSIDGLKVARKHLRLIDKEESIPSKLRKRIKSDIQLNLADDYYLLGDNMSAINHYLDAVGQDPVRAVDLHVVRQLIASLLPTGARAKIKSLLKTKNRQMNNPRVDG